MGLVAGLLTTCFAARLTALTMAESVWSLVTISADRFWLTLEASSRTPKACAAALASAAATASSRDMPEPSAVRVASVTCAWAALQVRHRAARKALKICRIVLYLAAAHVHLPGGRIVGHGVAHRLATVGTRCLVDGIGKLGRPRHDGTHHDDAGHARMLHGPGGQHTQAGDVDLGA